MTNSVSRRYAKALFDLAREEGAVSSVEDEAKTLLEAVLQDPALEGFLRNSFLPRDFQKKLVDALSSQGGLGDLLTKTLFLMIEKRRFEEIIPVLQDYCDLAQSSRGVLEALVETPKNLTKTQEAALAKALGTRFGKDIALNISLNESLLAGLVVQVGSIMIDGSLKGKLDKAHNLMKEVG